MALIRTHDSIPGPTHPPAIHKAARLAGTEGMDQLTEIPVVGPRPMTYQLRIEDIVRDYVSVFERDPMLGWKIDSWGRRVRWV